MAELNWVLTEKYCERTGKTPQAIETMRRRGVWMKGKHWRIAGDGRVWINLKEVDLWAATSEPK